VQLVNTLWKDPACVLTAVQDPTPHSRVLQALKSV